MNDPTLRARAEEQLARALTASAARDPREFYRGRLRELRERDGAAFQRAVDYFEHTLVPRVAGGEADPLAEWLEYGRLLAELTAPGRTVQVDASGQASPYARPVPREALVLHLPLATQQRALVVGLPPRLSSAQSATYALLVEGRQELGGA